MKKILTFLAVLLVAVAASADEFTVEKTNFSEFTKNANYLDYKLAPNVTFEIRCKKYSASSTDGSLGMSYSDFISMKITGVTIKSLELTFASEAESPSNAANGFYTDTLTTIGVVASGNKLTYSGSNWGIYLYFKGGSNPNLKLTGIKVTYDDGWTHVKTNPQLVKACEDGKTKIKLDADIDLYNYGLRCNYGTEICGERDSYDGNGEPYYALKRPGYCANGMKFHHVVIKGQESCMNGSVSSCTLEEVIFEGCHASYKGDVGGIFARFAHECTFRNIMFMDCSMYGYKEDTGLLAGRMEGCTVENCMVNATCAVFGKNGKAGTLVGQAKKNTTIKNCYSYGIVLGNGDDLGGIVGRMEDGSVTNCHFAGIVKHTSSISEAELIERLGTMLLTDKGYFVAYALFNLSTLNDIYVFATVLSTSFADASAAAAAMAGTGGIAGLFGHQVLRVIAFGNDLISYELGWMLSTGLICYSIGTAVSIVANAVSHASGPDNAGGIAGYTKRVAISNCSNYGSIFSLDAHGGGILGHGEDGTTITNSLNQGAVHGGETTAGIVGRMGGGSVKYCLNIGNVGCDHTSNAGRICGATSGTTQQYNGYSSRTSNIAGNPGNNIQFSQQDLVSGQATVYLNQCAGDTIWHQSVGTDHWPILMSGHYLPTNDSIDTSLSIVVKATDKNTLFNALVNPYSDIEIENDIDLGGNNAIIFSSEYMPFEGTVDGKGHTISNLNYSQTGRTYKVMGIELAHLVTYNVGLLGYAKGARFMNFNLKDIHINPESNAHNMGILVGSSENSIYDNIHLTGLTRIYQTKDKDHDINNVGGLIGYSENDSIRNCSVGTECSFFINNGGDVYLGGLVGYGSGTYIDKCWSGANINCKGKIVGGIVGYGTNIHVRNSANLGNITSYGKAGGLVGYLCNNSTLEYCTESCSMTDTKNGSENGLIVGKMLHKNDYPLSVLNCLSFGNLTSSDADPIHSIIGKVEKSVCYTVGSTYYQNHNNGERSSNLSSLMPELAGYSVSQQDDIVRSGAVAYYLNTHEGGTWYQSIDNSAFTKFVPLPVDTAGVVYTSVTCDGSQGFTNKHAGSTQAHTSQPDLFGYCEICGYLCKDDATYHIADSTSLIQFANAVNRGRDFTDKTIYLDNDINLDSCYFPVIGRNSNLPFRGTFDGQGHRIRNMNLEYGGGLVGLFGVVAGTSTIKNVIIDSSCSVSSIYGTGVAGLVGGTKPYNGVPSNVTIENCGNEASVTGVENVAGLLGGVYENNNNVVNINNCYNTGAITGESSQDCAAIVGYARTHTNIRNTWNSGSTSCGVHYYYAFAGTWEGVAAKVNKNVGKFDGTVENCYTTTSWDRTPNVSKVTTAQVKSGELCGALNIKETVFTQKVGTDAYPYPGTDGLSGISILHIKTADELVAFANKVNTKATSYAGYIVNLDNDIDLSGRTDFTGIGTGSNSVPFEGTFNGQGHRIKNWVVTYSNEGGGHGFFRRVTGANTIIKNLIIDSSCSITTNSETYGTAGIVGFATSTSGTACNVIIENCGNEAKVTGYGTVSGILGGVYNNTSTNLTIQNCYNIGAIKATKKDASALCASTDCKRSFTNCYNAGTVSGVTDKHYFYDNSTGSGTVSGCYDTNASQTGVTLITADQVQSGELCYLLNNPSTGSGTAGTTAFSQDVSTESHPVFGTEGLTGIEETHITDAAGLISFAAEVSAAKNTKLFNVYLDNDIDLSGRTDFKGISGGSEAPYYFKGTFNGQGHRIKNWIVTNSEGYGLGFFRRVAGANTIIRNLTIDSSCSITSTGEHNGTAGLVGYTSSTPGTPCNITIENCGNEANVSGYGNVAGLLGGVYNNDYTVVNVNNCYNTGTIGGTSNSESGSIVGYARKHTSIRNTWNSGNIGGTTDYLTFAFTGADNFDGTLENCYTTCTWDKTPGVTIDETAMRLGIMCNDLNTYVQYARSQGIDYKYWTQDLEYDSHPYFTESDSVMEDGDGVTYSRSMDNKWGTIVLPFNVDLSDNDLPYECYQLASITGNVVKLSKVTGKLKGGVPALIHMNQSTINAETGKYELTLLSNGTYTENPNDTIIEPVDGLTIKGCFATTDLANVSGYMLEDGYLKNISSASLSSLAPFRAYVAGTLADNPSILIIEDSVTISNADELIAFSNAVNSGTDFSGVTVYLLNDIDCSTVSAGSQTPFIAIGNEAHPYKGSFDGLGYRIKNLTLVSDTAEVGFFGVIAGAATIIRNTIIDSSCSVTAARNAGVAGLVGCVQTVPAICNITIENCGNEATITGVENVAGLVGGVYAYDDTKLKIANCYNTGTINGQKVSAAFCGYARKNYTITNCYNSGTVTGVTNSDWLYHGKSGGVASVSNCYDVNGSQTGVEKVTAEQVRLGYVCQQLNANRGTYRAWIQDIATDATPGLSPLSSQLSAEGLHYTRTMTNKWGTVCLPFDIDADADADYEFYELSGVGNDVLTLNKLHGTLAAGTPAIILRREDATGIDIAASDTEWAEIPVEGSSADDLTLTGSYTTKEITSENGYIIANNAFWDIQQIKGSNKVYCSPFRAYLAGTANNARCLSIGEGETTGIEEVLLPLSSGEGWSEASIYDLNGHRLNNFQTGVNIIRMKDGTTRKVIIR